MNARLLTAHRLAKPQARSSSPCSTASRRVRISNFKFRASLPALTILELIVSLAIFAAVLIVIAQAIFTIQGTWLKTRTRADQYRNARVAIETIARRLSLATLAAQWHTPNDDGASPPQPPQLQSHLHFISGPASDLVGGAAIGHAVFFQAPLGKNISPTDQSSSGGTTSDTIGGYPPTRERHDRLTQTLNAWGYFVEYASDSRQLPGFLADQPDIAPARQRFRLMEYRQPTSLLPLFQMETASSTAGAPRPLIESQSSPNNRQWFTTALSKADPSDRHTTLIADNIAALILRPLPRPTSQGSIPPPPSYAYDSRPPGDGPASLAIRHRLPPAIQIIAVAISEEYLESIEVDPSATANAANTIRSAINSRFSNPGQIDQDLAGLERDLSAKKIPHTIVSQTVVIPEGL